jgi:hypothetical protein
MNGRILFRSVLCSVFILFFLGSLLLVLWAKTGANDQEQQIKLQVIDTLCMSVKDMLIGAKL